jgi:uncharacterized protein YjbJ (UPF0337 family)
VSDDQVDDTAKQVSGSLKEAIGKVTGDVTTQAEGEAEKRDGARQTDLAGQCPMDLPCNCGGTSPQVDD